MSDDKTFNNAGFAEIEYDSGPGTVSASETGRESIRPVLSGGPGRVQGREYAAHAPQAIPIGQRTVDPIRKRFEDMRSITSGNPFARNDSGYFYRQAKLMEDFSDNYQGDADFFMYYPCYHQMSHNQLRTYFSWRTKIRNGNMPLVSLSYAFLYIYELLSGIGVEGPSDGLERLMLIWNAYRVNTQSLDYYMPGWLYDYHVYYELPHSFADFIKKNDMLGQFGDLLLFDSGSGDCFASWAGISGYDVTKSKFFTDGNEELMRDCFNAVIRGIRDKCGDAGISVYDLISRNYVNETSWHPFRRALFHNWLDQPDRSVEMPGERTYRCKDNHWTTNLSLPYAWRRDFAAYLIKRTEMCLRQAVKFKHKITADPGVVEKRFRAMAKPRLEFKELDAAIVGAVEGFLREKNRTVVSVDHGNLARIRAEALGTQEALIVPESEPPGFPQPAAQADQAPPTPPTPTEAFTPDSFSPAALSPPTGAGSSIQDGWTAFADALDETELKALKMLSDGDGDIKKIADEYGVMLEVLADGINEKAMDFIGDSILELDENMSIFDEYLAKVSEIVKVNLDNQTM